MQPCSRRPKLSSPDRDTSSNELNGILLPRAKYFFFPLPISFCQAPVVEWIRPISLFGGGGRRRRRPRHGGWCGGERGVGDGWGGRFSGERGWSTRPAGGMDGQPRGLVAAMARQEATGDAGGHSKAGAGGGCGRPR